MKIEMNDAQLRALITLVQSEIEKRKVEGSADTNASDLDDLEMLEDLRDSLEKVKESDGFEAHWMGYVKSRNVPSNPPPGT